MSDDDDGPSSEGCVANADTAAGGGSAAPRLRRPLAPTLPHGLLVAQGAAAARPGPGVRLRIIGEKRKSKERTKQKVVDFLSAKKEAISREKNKSNCSLWVKKEKQRKKKAIVNY